MNEQMWNEIRRKREYGECLTEQEWRYVWESVGWATGLQMALAAWGEAVYETLRFRLCPALDWFMTVLGSGDGKAARP